MTGFESFVAEELGSTGMYVSTQTNGRLKCSWAYLKDMPYCETASYPDFQTNVTSQALVAWSRHDKKAEMGLPPTTMTE